mmetsp:Transcript_2486/g.5249  ORF Transcript_2486/g.5249 Transcript_2486/m.5249 type:complete len:212 (-) Transcript_2486:1477-2112(-)
MFLPLLLLPTPLKLHGRRAWSGTTTAATTPIGTIKGPIGLKLGRSTSLESTVLLVGISLHPLPSRGTIDGTRTNTTTVSTKHWLGVDVVVILRTESGIHPRGLVVKTGIDVVVAVTSAAGSGVGPQCNLFGNVAIIFEAALLDCYPLFVLFVICCCTTTGTTCTCTRTTAMLHPELPLTLPPTFLSESLPLLGCHLIVGGTATGGCGCDCG